jgi:hypothetical protein
MKAVRGGAVLSFARGLSYLEAGVGAEENGALGGSSPTGGVDLVTGEEIRSREAGEDAEMAARHLVLSGAALGACDCVFPGCGDDR